MLATDAMTYMSDGPMVPPVQPVSAANARVRHPGASFCVIVCVHEYV